MFSEIYSILSFCVEQYGELVKWRGAGNSLKSRARARSPPNKCLFVHLLAFTLPRMKSKEKNTEH